MELNKAIWHLNNSRKLIYKILAVLPTLTIIIKWWNIVRTIKAKNNLFTRLNRQ